MERNDSKSNIQLKYHHIVFWIGFGLLVISNFLREDNRLSFWIAVTTNILTTAVLFFEVKKEKKDITSIRKELALLGISLMLLIAIGVIAF